MSRSRGTIGSHNLADLQVIVSQACADWRIALESMKGVYVIHDKETGQRYGGTGVWQRRATYAATLHGGNVGLKALLKDKADEYYRTNMRFAFLEDWSMRTGLPSTDATGWVVHLPGRMLEAGDLTRVAWDLVAESSGGDRGPRAAGRTARSSGRSLVRTQLVQACASASRCVPRCDPALPLRLHRTGRSRLCLEQQTV